MGGKYAFIPAWVQQSTSSTSDVKGGLRYEEFLRTCNAARDVASNAVC